jgi:hypothetical protein
VSSLLLNKRLLINLTPFKFLFGNPPSLSPSLDKGGRINYIREASPLFDSPFVFTPSKRIGDDIKKKG